MIYITGPATPLEEAEMWLACAVAAGGHLEHWEQDELIENFRREVERAAAARIIDTESRRHPGAIYGSIRRLRACYYAALIRPEEEG
ncbi:hypothetical protein [Streptomyces sp. CB03911]|uniref:hypothetical protein n=1 Tax=Streptomyces sp. CB03911 TaxID=1804758 RepID=UPI00093B20B4|nr:hypothetical protein [Streptomyces sp. CB03911]OKI19286.1 hypothetical protein A6A07_07230 [Streptomyces sp. CB03911]